jgi:hypothetical protein
MVLSSLPTTPATTAIIPGIEESPLSYQHAGWTIQLKFTTFNLETGEAYVYVSNIHRMSVFDAAVIQICLIFCQVGDDVSFVWYRLQPTTGNIIPAVVPHVTVDIRRNSMDIFFSTSTKTNTTTHNWRATFSVTVNFILHQRLLRHFSSFIFFIFLYLDRAKAILVPLIQVITLIFI